MDTADVEMLQRRAAQQSRGQSAGAAARPLPLRHLRLYSQSQAGQALQAPQPPQQRLHPHPQQPNDDMHPPESYFAAASIC